MAILETFPNKGGHTFTDADSPITNRDTVNLIDFDIDDDSTNEKTDINPHRLTSAELDDIVAGVPNGYNDMPVVYDERGTEYVVGKYIKSDGTSVPVYQKTFNIGSQSAANANVYYDLTGMNIDKGWIISGWYDGYGSTDDKGSLVTRGGIGLYIGKGEARSVPFIRMNCSGYASNFKNMTVTAQYTKTS